MRASASPPDRAWPSDLVGDGWGEEAFAVALAEQEGEAGEAVAERLDAVGVAADEAGEGLVDRAANVAVVLLLSCSPGGDNSKKRIACFSR
jgi:hypothetical protein